MRLSDEIMKGKSFRKSQINIFLYITRNGEKKTAKNAFLNKKIFLEMINLYHDFGEI